VAAAILLAEAGLPTPLAPVGIRSWDTPVRTPQGGVGELQVPVGTQAPARRGNNQAAAVGMGTVAGRGRQKLAHSLVCPQEGKARTAVQVAEHKDGFHSILHRREPEEEPTYPLPEAGLKGNLPVRAL
jgi:hypothetical protein